MNTLLREHLNLLITVFRNIEKNFRPNGSLFYLTSRSETISLHSKIVSQFCFRGVAQLVPELKTGGPILFWYDT